MTLKDINSLKCMRGQPIDVREYVFVCLEALKNSGVALVANKKNYVHRFEDVCKEKNIDVEVFARPYLGILPNGRISHYSFAYFFDRAKGNAFIEKYVGLFELQKLEL